MTPDLILTTLILVAGFYMAWNIGANDVANAMGTSVGSGALTLRRAVLLAACLEFAGAYFFGSYVSETIQSGIVNPIYFVQDPRTLVLGMLSALISAGVWLQIASYYGWPVSTTHSIVGAILGFGLVSGGVGSIEWESVGFIFSSWIISPIIGGVLSFTLFHFLRRYIFYSRRPIEAAVKLTPFLTFIVIFIMAMLFVFLGLHNLNLDLDIFYVTVISLVVAAVAGLGSHVWAKKLAEKVTHTRKQPSYGPEIAVELDKARRHLDRVKSSASGELNYYVSVLIEEVDGLSASLREEPEEEADNSEYTTVERIFSKLQVISAGFMAFAHGANDVANAIGPLSAALALLKGGTDALNMPIPTWLLGFGGLGIVVGLATWGWRVIQTIGTKITELTPSRGFVAEFSAATTVVVASRLGLPISTTHTLVGAVIGIAFARGIGALNLSMTRDILISWIVTIPAGALLAIGTFYGLLALLG